MATTQAGIYPLEQIKPLEQMFAMSKGDDENSYSKNSDVQKSLVDLHAIPRLDEAVQLVTLPPAGKAIVVADLGCSSGPNSIYQTAHVIKSLRLRSPDSHQVQAFFNDLPSNDFNTFFQLWSSEIKGDFFGAGVPGSFYGRLLPDSTVHVFLSYLSLMFLSKIPDEIYDKSSPAFNGDSLYIDDAPAAVDEVYKKQAARDLRNFLNARATELAPGGLLFVMAKGSGYTGKGVKKGFMDDDAADAFFMGMTSAWKTLQSKGILTKEQTATFNFPLYSRTLDELKEGIESCSTEFRTHKVEMVKGKLFVDAYNVDINTVDRVAFCKAVYGFSRGILGGYLEGIVGSEKAEIFWEEFIRTIERDFVPQLLGYGNFYVLSLIRN